MKFIDRVKEATATTGTADFVLAGAVAGFQSFAGYAVGERVPYCAALGAEWEVGIGTKAASSIARTTVTASSNGGALVNFSAGTKELYVNAGAAFLSSLPQTLTTAFSQAIPLSVPGATYMAAHTVAGPLTFTAMAGAVQGALAYLRLTADGTNAPNFSAFKEWGGSSGYDNRNGIVNQLQFFYDGADLFYSASQAVGAVPAAAPDTTAPTLTSPTSTSTGTTTGSGAVTTDEGNGTLYFLATINATETAATVKASGATQAITTTGSKAVTVSGLTASTAYYIHFVHSDATGNDSVRVSSASFTTAAVGDTTAPVLSAPTGTQTGANTASGSVTTDEANGTLYRMVSINAVESAATVKAAALTSAVTATGAQAVSFTGLTAATTYYAHYVHRDAAGNDSLVSSSASFITAAAAAAETTIRLTGAKSADVVESAAAPWTYTSTGGATGATGAMSTLAIPAATDGEVVWKVVTKSNDFMVGVSTNSGIIAYSQTDTESIWSNGGSAYKTFGTAGTTSAVVPANGDLIRFRKYNSSGSADFRVGFAWEVSKDNGATWTTISTNVVGTNGLRTQPYYFRVVPGANAVLSVVSQVGFA